jgi:hypothetical protein
MKPEINKVLIADNLEQAIEYAINSDISVNQFNYIVRELEENKMIKLNNNIFVLIKQ